MLPEPALKKAACPRAKAEAGTSQYRLLRGGSQQPVKNARKTLSAYFLRLRKKVGISSSSVLTVRGSKPAVLLFEAATEA